MTSDAGPRSAGDAAQEPSAIAELLLGLLRRTHLSAPSELAAVVADEAASIGASDVVIYLIDYGHSTLVPLPRGRGSSTSPLSVAGTVAGKTYGVAKKAKLVGVRVLDCNGSGAWDGIIRGIDWVTANGKKPAVVNMSLGGSGTNASLENAVKRSIGAGITYVLAGGNSGQDACGFTPARTPEAITVGASDRADKRSIWSAGSSNYGTCLDIWAPGSDIVSASHSNDTGTRSMGGTSMASPHVAGAAALYLSANPSATPAQVRNALVGAATPNKLTDIRTGSPNLVLKV
jgi:subtilisin family serine protease